MAQNPLDRAINIIGLRELGRQLNRSYQSVTQWLEIGHLPRTEFTGETDYAAQIEALTDGQVTQLELLEWSKRGLAVKV